MASLGLHFAEALALALGFAWPLITLAAWSNPLIALPKLVVNRVTVSQFSCNQKTLNGS